MSSRNNAKLLQFTRGREQKRSASSMSKAFTSKQSHYARRSEEEAIRRETVADASAPTTATTSNFEGAHHKTSTQFDHATRRMGRQGRGGAFSLNDPGDNALSAESRMGRGGVRTAANVERDDETGEPMSGKRARFEQILDHAKDQRAEKKVLRNEAEKETDQLDKAFGEIQNLLETKTKREEAQEAFYELGSEETRAKLAKFFESRTASKGREFVLKPGAKNLVRTDDGASSEAPIRAPEQVEARQKMKEEKKKRKQAQQAQSDSAAAAATDASESKVDPRVERLRASAGVATQDDDGFDKLLGQMIFSRKAHAGDRAYSGDDALLDQFQDEMLGVDQMRRAAAGGMVPDVNDVTRREWLQRGGDDVYRMGQEEEAGGGGDDNEDEEEGDDDDHDNGDEDIDFDAMDDGADEDFDFDRPDAMEQFARLKEQQKKVADKKVAKQQQKDGGFTLNAVDDALMKLEQTLNQCISPSSEDDDDDDSAARADRLRAALDALHETCAMRPKMAAESFRLLFLDISAQCQQQHAGEEKEPLSPFQLLILRAATRMFPMSDVSRHPVAAPLSLLLPSLMFYSPALDTAADAASLLFLASTMMELLQGGDPSALQQRKPFYASEPFLAICNVLALQLPMTALAPRGKTAKIDAPFPVLPRAADAVLTAAPASSCMSLIELLSLVDGKNKKKSNQQQQQQQQQQQTLSGKVLATAYDLAESFISTFLAHSPSGPALINSCVTDFFTPKLQQQHQRQTRLQALCDKIIAEIEGERAPLAMRTFRPRPLRVYEPLLLDDSADDVKDRKTMKKELREGKKRMIRTVQATASVERRQQERDAAAENAHRTGKLKEIMGELQEQHQTMKFVDAMKAKAKSKKRGKITGAPTGDPSGAEEVDNAGGAD